MSRPWMPLYVADYLGDTRRLKTIEHGAYMLLIMEYWQHGGLPDNDEELAEITGLDVDEWIAMRSKIARLFQDGWRHKRIDAELAKAADISERRKASAERRWCKGNANALQEQSKSNANGDANDMHRARVPQPQPHTPSLRSGETRAGRALAVEAKDAAQAFERFWEVWPNKTGKPVAARSFVKVWREADAIIAGVERYIANKPPDRSWLNPATFLNQRRWEDDPAPVAKARGSPAREETSGVAKLLAEAYGIDRRNGMEAAGHLADIRALPVIDGSVGIADHSDDGGLSGRLPRLE